MSSFKITIFYFDIGIILKEKAWQYMLAFSLIIICLGLMGYIYYTQIWLNKRFGYVYVIRFRGIEDCPDLSQNRQLREKIQIISHTEKRDVYTVQSELTNSRLKKILMTSYDLSTEQVSVQSGQLSGELGMV